MEEYKKWLLGTGMFLATAVGMYQARDLILPRHVENPQQEIQLEDSSSQSSTAEVKEQVREAQQESKLERPIKFHTTKDEEYFKEACSRAEEYLEQEVGLDIDFRFHGDQEMGDVELDHLRNFAVKEVSPDQRVKEIIEEAKMPPNNPHIEDLQEFYNLTGTLSVEYSSLLGRADTEGSTAYLLNSRSREEEKILNSTEELVRKETRYLVHEIAHLAGLYHPRLFPEDDLERRERGPINAMSLRPISEEGEYGFMLSDKQKDLVKSYFSKGRQYQRLKEADFSFYQYIDNLEESKDYGETGLGIIEKLQGE